MPRITPCSASPFLLFAAALLTLTGCSAVPHSATTTSAIKLAGTVHGGQTPVAAATIQLYAVASTTDGAAATPLILSPLTVTTSDGSGNATNANANAGNSFNSAPVGTFGITNDYICPVTNPSVEVYLVATHGNPGQGAGVNNTALAEMAALGPCNNLSSSTFIAVNELTTVASVAALYPYMTSYSAVGSGTSDAANLQAAFSAVNEYVNTTTGTVPGPTLPASTYASTYEINSLADALSACINSAGGVAGQANNNCGTLFTDATPTSGSPIPNDTIGALINILKNPTTVNTCGIFGLIPAGGTPYLPTISACPSTWSLPISTLSVSISGASSLYVGQTALYSATVTGASNQSVTWQVNGVAGGTSTTGTISTSGLYTPPVTTSSLPITISAVSALSSTAIGSASVTVQPVTVSVSGPVNVLFSQTGQYTATVTGNSAQSVTWQVNGVTGGTSTTGTISTSGLYTAPAVAPTTTVTITAQSNAVPSATGSLGLTLSPTIATYATGDARTVTQPTYPTICATLTAQFNTSQRSSPPAAASDDTTRIQAALSSAACKNTGKSVELALSGSNNAFFSELLTATGDGLIIDSGVTLYGGANYNTQSELLYFTGTNASLMGPGIVDGRGDLLTGTTRLVQTNNASNFIAYNVTLQQSIYPNLYVQGGNGITIWGITILTPDTRANADGIDLDSLTNATVINSTIEDGDDGVAVKTNSAAASNITVINNRLYGTHGLSIGSQTFNGVSNILFTGNYLYGTDLLGNISGDANGINIKTAASCGGTVQQVTYQNTCMSGVKHLITLSTNYPSCSGNAGIPVWTNVIINGVLTINSIAGAYSEFNGYSSTNPSQAFLANINLDANALGSGPTQYAAISLYNSTLVPTGTGVTTSNFTTPGSVPTCTF